MHAGPKLLEALDYAMMLIEEPAYGTNQAYAEAALRKARAAIVAATTARPPLPTPSNQLSKENQA
jgi:hypothetical protein